MVVTVLGSMSDMSDSVPDKLPDSFVMRPDRHNGNQVQTQHYAVWLAKVVSPAYPDGLYEDHLTGSMPDMSDKLSDSFLTRLDRQIGSQGQAQ